MLLRGPRPPRPVLLENPALKDCDPRRRTEDRATRRYFDLTVTNRLSECRPEDRCPDATVDDPVATHTLGRISEVRANAELRSTDQCETIRVLVAGQRRGADACARQCGRGSSVAGSGWRDRSERERPVAAIAPANRRSWLGTGCPRHPGPACWEKRAPLGGRVRRAQAVGGDRSGAQPGASDSR
jgi:hypothetical protein